MQRRIRTLAAADIPTAFRHYPSLDHGTEAEGWLDEAVAFWEAQR